MSTPSSSDATGKGGRFFLRPYGWTVAVALLGFMVLAMVDEYRVFLPILGIADEPDEEATQRAGARAAGQLVGEFLTALEQAQSRPLTALEELPAAPQIMEQLGRAMAFARAQGEGPLRLQSFEILDSSSAGDGWSVLSDETWVEERSGESPRRFRLRYRYGVTLGEGGDRIESMQTVLPEPRREAATR